MENIPQSRKVFDAQHFPYGVNSYVESQILTDGYVRWAVNAVNKGGIWQTRPGYKTAFRFDPNYSDQIFQWASATGRLNATYFRPQFVTTFRPTTASRYSKYVVFGVSGSVFYAPVLQDHTLGEPVWIQQLSFNPDVEQLITCTTIKSMDIIDGVSTVITPKNVLMIQDGLTRCGWWDGSDAGHTNPAQHWTVAESDNTETGVTKGDTLFTAGYNQTPIGKFMAWSGNRLWVANGSALYASDINDPINFTEQITLVNVPKFLFPNEITALYDRGTSGTNNSQVFVFTSDTTWTIQSGVLDRSTWRTTSNLQMKIFDNVGCIAPKSVKSIRGLLYWYSLNGLVEFDGTGTVNSTQALPPMDTEMAYSKAVISGPRSNICIGERDSYLMLSVPASKAVHGQIVNGQTQVLDVNVIPVHGSNGGVSAWQGVWTGINPVEWVTDTIDGRIATYAISLDDDGATRIWEAFQGNRSDNGNRIEWSVETRTHPVTDTPFARNKIVHAALKLVQLKGDVDVKCSWRGTRGKYHEILDTKLTSTPGSILIPQDQFTPIRNNTTHYSLLKQTRTLITESIRGSQDDTDSSEVESPYTDSIDSAFSLQFSFKGIGALLAYRIATDAVANNVEGEVIDDETGFRLLPWPDTVDPFKIDGTTPDYLMVDDFNTDGTSALDPIYSIDDYSSTPDDPVRAPVDVENLALRYVIRVRDPLDANVELTFARYYWNALETRWMGVNSTNDTWYTQIGTYSNGTGYVWTKTREWEYTIVGGVVTAVVETTGTHTASHPEDMSLNPWIQVPHPYDGSILSINRTNYDGTMNSWGGSTTDGTWSYAQIGTYTNATGRAWGEFREWKYTIVDGVFTILEVIDPPNPSGTLPVYLGPDGTPAVP